MTPEELERLASATPPLPKEPENGNLRQIKDLLDTMKAIDEVKLAFLRTEQAKQDMLEKTITERVTAQLSMQQPGRDPLQEKAMEFLLNMGLNAFAGKSSPQTAQPPQGMPAPQIASQQPQDKAAEQKKEVETVQLPVTQSIIDNIADEIDDHFPNECQQFREGKIPLEIARAKLIEGKVPEQIVDRVLESIKNIEKDTGAPELTRREQ